MEPDGKLFPIHILSIPWWSEPSTGLTSAVNPPAYHHPLDACHDSVVDEPQ